MPSHQTSDHASDPDEEPNAFSTGLTDAERERLAVFMEECAEAIQVVGKIQRHGFESVDPTQPPIGPTNRTMLSREIADVYAAMQLLFVNDIEAEQVYSWSQVKLHKLSKWLHFQPAAIMSWLRSCNTPQSLPRPRGLEAQR